MSPLSAARRGLIREAPAGQADQPAAAFIDALARPVDSHLGLARRLSEIEQKTKALAINRNTCSPNTRAQFKQVCDALRELMAQPDPPKQPIEFINPEDKGKKTQARRKG